MQTGKSAPDIVMPLILILQLKPYEKFTLDNGVEVYAVNAGAEEVMSVEWVFFAGNWFEEKNLVAATTNFLLKNGTSKKTLFRSMSILNIMVLILTGPVIMKQRRLHFIVLNKHVGELLPVVKELITDSVFPRRRTGIFTSKIMKQRLKCKSEKK